MALCLLLALHGGAALSADGVDYNRDIRPILSDNCFLCHGPDEQSREAGLRLDMREKALEPADSGEKPIVPGRPDESELVRRIFSADDDVRMPPPDSRKKLTDRQRQLLKQWVAEGAKYQVHWAYAPLVRPAVPQIQKAEVRIQNAIDAFIVEKLLSQKIQPSPEADRRMLVRRLSLDLVGLPPAASDVERLTTTIAPSPPPPLAHSQKEGERGREGEWERAYEEYVDSLLASPHFGERMAVWWLDVARFTDTVGFHGDQNQRIFPYRDYVIDAFNRNKPFDQFTIEQLAGDLLPNPTPEQLVATGFNRLNMMTREGGAQPKEYLAKYGAERVRTIGSAWLGSTLTCVECHDHKYDPFTARDFYSLQAFFADIKQWGVYSDYNYTPNPELKGWSNDHPFPPEIEVESPFLQRRLAQVKAQLAGLVSATAAKRQANKMTEGHYQEWLGSMRLFLAENHNGWETPPSEPLKEADADAAPPPAKGKKKAAARTGKGAKGQVQRIEVEPATRTIAAVRLELLPGTGQAPARLPRQMVRVSATVRSADGRERAAGFYFADGRPKEPRYASTEEILGVTSGWLTSDKQAEEPHVSVWLFEEPVHLAEGESLVLTVRGDQSLPPARVSVSPLAGREALKLPDERLLAAIRADAATSTKAEQLLLDEAYLASTAADRAAFGEYVKLHREILECHGGKAWTMVTAAAEPLMMRVLPRGNWQDESGAVVEPATPAFLPGIANENGRRLTRLDLARWLCSPENPLVARTIVNRLWKQFFGNALSAVVDDLGAQGEPPSHPELLDWLAVEFRDSGWNVKHLVKLIVMSRTYRQSSSLRHELAEIDPANRLLASQNPRRLDAEFVRDNALKIAGLLNLELGGPSVLPYQPGDYYVNLQFPNRKYAASAAPEQWRRGVYMHWQRTFLHPMLANFDAQAREECIASRVVSNTPQQALTLLNDPEFVEAARVFAERLLRIDVESDEARIDRAFLVALARPANDKERTSLKKFLDVQREHFRANAADAEKLIRAGIAPAAGLDQIEHAAWMSLARVVLNLQETITRY
jgi:hypothetical protein